MRHLACVVEGHGDVASIPVIVRRIAAAEGVHDLHITPFRTHRQRIVRPGEIERLVERAARGLGGEAAVLVVLDADDDLACELGPALARRAAAARPDLATAVVLATREKEAWFVASIESLRSLRDIPPDAAAPDLPESIRDAKGWLRGAMGRPYSEVADQPALSARFDLALTRRRAPSFDKLWRELGRLLQATAD